jgi:uncharacterized membrane protein
MPIGPTQLLVIEFPEPDFRGGILAELQRLRSLDLIRVIDAVLVQKDLDGNVTHIVYNDLDSEDAIAFGTAVGALIGLGAGSVEVAEQVAAEVTAEVAEGELLQGLDVVDVLDEIEPGTAAGVLLLEHRWAVGLRDAIVDAGGVPVTDIWVHPLDLVAVGLEAAQG